MDEKRRIEEMQMQLKMNSINPKIANQFQIIFTHNLLINNTVTILNFNMVVLTSKFNYLYRSNNSDFLVLQAPPL
jgi:hypothetical protein